MVFQEGVEEDDEFTHECREGDFAGLAAVAEALVESFESWVIATGHQCGHVEGLACGRSAAPDKPLALPMSAFARVRRYSGQSGRLAAIECAEFGQFCEQGGGGFGANAWDLLERLGFIPQLGICAQ